jgi:hypothetical protein
MTDSTNKPPKHARRLMAVDAVPESMRDDCLLPWDETATICGLKDAEYCREVLTKAGVPLVHVSARRKLPRYGDVKAYLKSRTVAA